MSPTEAILIRKVLLSGSGRAAGTTAVAAAIGSTATTTGAGTSDGGALAQAPSNASARIAIVRGPLITEPYAEYINFRGVQAAAQHVELLQIIGRTYAHAVVRPVVYRYSLNL